MKSPVPSGQMKGVFLLSVLLMGLHKIESFQTNEWESAPVYRYFLNLDLSKGETLFLAFVVMLFIGLFWVWVLLRFRIGKWLFLGVWGLTFLLEWHHLFRTVNLGQYYSGLFSAIIYVLFGFIYWGVFLTHFLRSKNALQN